jgi:hypothetical protein
MPANAKVVMRSRDFVVILILPSWILDFDSFTFADHSYWRGIPEVTSLYQTFTIAILKDFGLLLSAVA